MFYQSTRGKTKNISFIQAVKMGLANDGGLLIPQYIPVIKEDLSQLNFRELTLYLMKIYIGDEIEESTLWELIQKSYSSFDTDEIVPIIKKDDIYIAELFHGPTLAFKDIALQFLGNLFEYILQREEKKMNILGATSGDTGSAAIEGVRGKKNMNIFILYPYGKVSPIQQKQMTTVEEKNVFCIAINGSFDDCQYIVKKIFSDIQFKQKYMLGAVNSINWTRILAQIIYYFYAYFQIHTKGSVYFSVPTGNFGNIFAGFIAKKMGLDIDKLILATNENDILSKFVNTGIYKKGKVTNTISPSMDIQIASNFERYLYYLFDENGEKIRQLMNTFSKYGEIKIDKQKLQTVQADFLSAKATETETTEEIRNFYKETGYILDPHTAVGVKVGRQLRDKEKPLICLATAHPAKFRKPVEKGTGMLPPIPPSLQNIEKKKEKFTVIDASFEQVKTFIEQYALR
jgi:threonine synthase